MSKISFQPRTESPFWLHKGLLGFKAHLIELEISSLVSEIRGWSFHPDLLSSGKQSPVFIPRGFF